MLAASSDAISTLLYRINLWPSVATKVVLVLLKLIYTPVMAGRSSSLLVAKMVLLIALLNTSVDISTTVGLVTAAILGKSVAFSPANLYRPLSELISMLYVSLSMLKVTGCSGRFFRVSINILAGTAILPSSFASRSISVIMEVCRSEAVTVNFPSLISKRKFSKIGTTGLVVTTPLMADRCFKRVEELTINFIDIFFMRQIKRRASTPDQQASLTLLIPHPKILREWATRG